MEQNSISQLLERMLQLYNNTLHILDRTNDAITTDKETVTLNLYNSNSKKYDTLQIPSFGYLKTSIERLETTFKNLINDSGSSNVLLPDGSFRKIITSTIPKPGINATYLETPKTFNFKNNEFFEDYLNPLLYFTLDLTSVSSRINEVYVERYIFDNLDPNTTTFFNEQILNSGPINYDDLNSLILANNLKVNIDKQIIKAPLKSPKYYGVFDVVDISTIERRDVVANNLTESKTYKLLTLNKITYTDNTKGLKETEQLRVNDYLVVNNGNWTTRYQITQVSSDTSQIEVKLIEGFDPIEIGVESIKFYDTTHNANLKIDVNTGFGQNQVVFVKTIDPDSGIASDLYSSGIALNSNSLIKEIDGEFITLRDYYRSFVSDFGQYFKSLKVDYIPPSSVGVKPNSVVINPDNFKVTQINNHLTDNDIINKLKNLRNNKLSSEQNINKLDESINKKRNEINLKKYKTQSERDRDRNTLNSLLNDRSAESKTYTSIINEIKQISESNNLKNIAPKFRLRGFWSVPSPKQGENTIAQKVVQFKVRYRYISTSGTTSQLNHIAFNDDGVDKTAVLTSWNEVKTTARQRILNSNGIYEWAESKEESADEISFNSIDIPIQFGESIELQIKSLSEAGWPNNPVESDWSDVAVFDFPEGDLDFTTVKDLLSINEINLAKSEIISELESNGLYSHLGDGFQANEKFFYHSADNIASGFMTDEQKPISLYNYLKSLENKITALQEKLDNVKGEFKITIEDDLGNVYDVSNGSTISINAGKYIDELDKVNGTKKGHIVTKNYKVKISNSKTTPLELISRIIGAFDEPVNSSVNNKLLLPQKNAGSNRGNFIQEHYNKTYFYGNLNTSDFNPNDVEYNTYLRYDLVPVLYQNISEAEVALSNAKQEAGYKVPYFNRNNKQSLQTKSQFIYSRYTDLAGKPLYGDIKLGQNDIELNANLSIYDVLQANENYTIDALNNLLQLSGADVIPASFTIDVAREKIVKSPVYFGNIVAASGNDVNKAIEYCNSTNKFAVINVGGYLCVFNPHDHIVIYNAAYKWNSNYHINAPEIVARLRSGKYDFSDFEYLGNPTNYNKDTNTLTPAMGYRLGGSGSYFNIGFTESDRFKIGSASCHARLFLAPISREHLRVDSESRYGKKLITKDDGNSVSVDLIYQYRMTDYFGNDNDSGKLDGLTEIGAEKLTYKKKVGLDLYNAFNEVFKFDVEVYSTYD